MRIAPCSLREALGLVGRAGALSLFVGAFVVVACAPLAGVEKKECVPGCVNATTRLDCVGDSPRAEACPSSDEPCARAVCQAGTCGFEPAKGAPCGTDGTARCNEGYACIGPNARLSAILNHTCLVADDGKVWCWGFNPYGELGDGSTVDRPNPVIVKRLPDRASSVTAGYGHTCALLQDGRIACWGNNSVGQCGTGSESDPLLNPTIVPVPDVRFTAVVAGQGHTCALTHDGHVYCWGVVAHGISGVDPSRVTGSRAVGPTRVDALDDVKGIDTVKNHTCAVRSSQPTLVCWGSNVYLEYSTQPGIISHKLGPGAAGLEYSATPIPVPLPVDAVDVGMGYESTYAVGADNIAYAWGFNRARQLGTGSTEMFDGTPQPVKTEVPVGASPSITTGPTVLAGVRDVLRTDGSDQCAELHAPLRASRFVCWGGNDYGELGFIVEDSLNRRFPYAIPTQLPRSSKNLVRGEDHGCVLVEDGGFVQVWCFGQAELVGRGPVTVPEGTPSAPQLVPMTVLWTPDPFALGPEANEMDEPQLADQ